MAGTAAKSGIAVAMYELSAPYLLLLLGWIFAPLYIHCNIRTTPEYLEQRFNKICRYGRLTIPRISRHPMLRLQVCVRDDSDCDAYLGHHLGDPLRRIGRIGSGHRTQYLAIDAPHRLPHRSVHDHRRLKSVTSVSHDPFRDTI